MTIKTNEARPAILAIFKEAVELNNDQLINVFAKLSVSNLEHLKSSITSAITKKNDIAEVHEMIEAFGLSISDITLQAAVIEASQDTLALHVNKTKKIVKPKPKLKRKVKSLSERFEIGQEIVRLVNKKMIHADIMEKLNINSASQFYYNRTFFSNALIAKEKFGVEVKKIEVGQGVKFEVAVKLIESVATTQLRKLSANSDYRVAEYKTFRAVLIEVHGNPIKIKLMTQESYNTFITA